MQINEKCNHKRAVADNEGIGSKSERESQQRGAGKTVTYSMYGGDLSAMCAYVYVYC